MLQRTLLAVVVLGASAPAAAAPCSASENEVAWAGTDFAEIGGDTGWFPSNFAAQLRLTGRVVGETAVSAATRSQLCWAGPMQGTIDAKRTSGYFDVAYGAEIHLYAKVDTSILGNQIYWEGEIPIPYIPRDLLLAGATGFDPTLDAQVDAQLADGTAPITILSTDLIGNLISIIGISGGLRITVTPSMVATYRSTEAHLGPATATSGTQLLTVPRPESGFGAALELPVSIDGVVRYAPTLSFGARFYISILGYKVVDYELFSVPMSLPAIDRPLSLTAEAPARFALPVLDGIGEGARIDFASGVTQVLAIRNRGELALRIDPAAVPAGVTVNPIEIAAGGSGQLTVTIAEGALETTQILRLTTTDPDHPELEVALGLDVGGTDPGMIEEFPEEGGCSTGSAGSFGGVLLVLFVARRRRRGV